MAKIREWTSNKPAKTLLAAACVLSALACKEEPSARRQPPPPPAAAKPHACSGPKTVNAPSNLVYLPKQIGKYCIDPTGSDRAYGEGASSPIDEICGPLDGECEIYKQHRIVRFVDMRYIDDEGSDSTIDVYLSKFSDSKAAYAMFTKRVVGDGDPAHPDTPKPIPGGGAAVLGIGNAYLWRGSFLAEMTYNDSTATSREQVEKRANELLRPLSKALGEKLAGTVELPDAAKRLPSDKRLSMGIRLHLDKLLGVKDTGPGAVGYYRDGDARWRLLSVVKGDADQAKDIIKTMLKQPGAKKEKRIAQGGVRVTLQRPGGAPSEWLIARRKNVIVGIGDEPLVLRAGMSADEHRGKTLSRETKRKRLKGLLR